MITITQKEYALLTSYIKSNYGIHLKDEKKALVMGRLQNVLLSKGFQNFTEYYEYIQKDKTGEALTTLVNKITTNHTFFMREPDHFYYFRNEILPHLIKTVVDKDLRIWSAGCSTGEEPYTLAMMVNEVLGTERSKWETKILATDISLQVLETAAKGIYPKESVAPLPAQWKLSYFQKNMVDTFIVKDEIRDEIIFRKFNLMTEVFPFKRKFHVIFCRNVMIYFDEKTKQTLVQKYYDELEYGGYLFIGHSEALIRGQTKFQCVAPAIYRKI